MTGPARRGIRRAWVAGLVLTFLLAGFVSGFASSSPDGLERVAGEQGFLDAGRDSAVAGSPLADYALRGVEDERLAGGLAGLLGAVLTLAAATALFYAVSRLTRASRHRAAAEA